MMSSVVAERQQFAGNQQVSLIEASVGGRAEFSARSIELEYGVITASPTETPTKTPVKPDTAPVTPTKPEEPPYEPADPRPGRTCPTREPGTLPVCVTNR
jgi:hypothetical protein